MSLHTVLIRTCAAVAVALAATVAARATTVNWDHAFALQSAGGLQNPGVLVGFNPQPEPPARITELDTSVPPEPVLILRDQENPDGGHQLFDVFLALAHPGVQFSFTGPVQVNKTTVHTQARDDAGAALFDIQFEIVSSSGGVVDPGSLVGFNPQPEPPAGYLGGFGMTFGIDSLSDVFVTLRVFDSEGTQLSFAEVPAPGGFALLMLPVGWLAWRRRPRGAIARRRIGWLALTALLIPAGPASAVVIDSFNEGSVVFAHNSPPPGFRVATGAGIIGGERYLTGSFRGTNGIAAVDFFDSNQLGMFADTVLDPSDGPILLATLQYDGINGTFNDFDGLGSVDLTEGGTHNALRVRVVNAIVKNEFFLQITLRNPDTTGGHDFYTVATTFGSTGPVDLLLPFDEVVKACVVCDAFDPTDVGWIGVEIFTFDAPTVQLSVDFIDTAFAPEEEIAAPAPLALLAAMLGLLALRRQRGAAAA
jgi:hypothetical protein